MESNADNGGTVLVLAKRKLIQAIHHNLGWSEGEGGC